MITADTIRPNTVNVLIGPNGSGKSRLLRELCVSFLSSGENVIAIAPTIYDRFRRMPQRGLRFFGARQGRAAATRVLRSVLERAASDDLQVFKKLTRALEYTKFDPVVGIRVSDINLDNFRAAEEHLSRREAEQLRSALMKWQSRSDRSSAVRMRLDTFSFEELDALTFAILALHADLLHWSKTTSRVEYFLYRNGEEIPLLEACSGEISFIATIAFIATQIEPRSVIAIDEPETSLHPTWQRDYVRTLFDLFYHYEPRILISTHSPIIISAAEYSQGDAFRTNLVVYQMADGQALPFEYAGLSLEALYDRLFGLITPKNHYLSQLAVSLLNALNAGERNLDQVFRELEHLRAKCYDESQKLVITKVEEMAQKLETIRQQRGRA